MREKQREVQRVGTRGEVEQSCKDYKSANQALWISTFLRHLQGPVG